MSDIYLGTVAIEPNRWATVDPSWCATIAVSEWLDRIEAAGFDGVEIWEKHLTEADEQEAAAVLDHSLPVSVFNSYASFDAIGAESRKAAAKWVRRSEAGGVKYNLGNDPDSEEAYVERLVDFAADLGPDVRLLCECHKGISVMEDPVVAARVFEEAGGADNLEAICHLGEDPEYMRSKFEHLGERISHIHVNLLDAGSAPRLAEIEPQVAGQVALVKSLGFEGTWTVEFSHGLLTDRDEPGFILESAAADLEVLRAILDD